MIECVSYEDVNYIENYDLVSIVRDGKYKMFFFSIGGGGGEYKDEWVFVLENFLVYKVFGVVFRM